MTFPLLSWQTECLSRWRANHFRGIANVVTGAGKTVLAVAAIELLAETLAASANPRPLKIKIVVPKTFLLHQWYRALNEHLDSSLLGDGIGFFSGSYKTNGSRKIMLYVVNSARSVLVRQVVVDLNDGADVFLIADECHHYGSDENAKIFGYAPHIPRGANVYTLGLSATPLCRNYDEVLVPALGNEIFRFTFFNALKEDIISKFIVFNICVSFDEDEAAEYEELSEKLGVALFRLKEKVPALRLKNGDAFFRALENIIQESGDETAELAKTVLFFALRRKDVVYLAKSRIDCVINLVKSLRNTSRIIIFSERIETAEEIFRKLVPFFPNETGLYHSKIPKETGRNTLRQFESSEIRILISCKTLDEGLNVSEADVGIIVSSTGSKRQRVQRLGRVLRKKSTGSAACFYYIFVDNTSEEDGLLNELADKRLNDLVKVIDLRYDSAEFENPIYFERVLAAARKLDDKSDEIFSEFLRNAKLGLLTGGWLMSEADCREKIKLAAGRRERNYYIAMLMVIRQFISL